MADCALGYVQFCGRGSKARQPCRGFEGSQSGQRRNLHGAIMSRPNVLSRNSVGRALATSRNLSLEHTTKRSDLMYILGVDVGGTFTDLVAIDASTGEIRTTKIVSLKGNPAEALNDGITELQLDRVPLVRTTHGTTVGTNALVERRGAVTALITTRGFRDITEIGRGRRLVFGAMFDSRFRRAPPLVPRSRRFEVNERLNEQGVPITALDTRELLTALKIAREAEVTSIAICLLHSYRNSAHEDAAAALVRKELGDDMFVSVSSDVDPQFREFERFSTTVANAYIGPTTRAHLDNLRHQRNGCAASGRTFVMSSSGGVIDFDTATRYPVRTILSGPAGGVMAARAIGRQLGFSDLITCDMGGTSTDVALLKGDRLLYADETMVSGVPLRASQLDINTIGAGAGSLIWLDVDGALRVGPASAGSTPGPACYRRGGQAPTVTDANVVLHRIQEGTCFGGKILVDGTAASDACAIVQETLGLEDVHDLAQGALSLVEVQIVSAIREISLERGFDPRDFALVVFGGAGPMHGCQVAEGLGMRRVIVPNGPGVFSAFGLILANTRRERVISYLSTLSAIDMVSLRQVLGKTIDDLSEQLLSSGAIRETIVSTFGLEMRCVGQSHEILVPIPMAPTEISRDEIELLFRETYSERYGQPPNDRQDREVIALRVVCEGRTESLPPIVAAGQGETHPMDFQLVWFGGKTHPTKIYQRSALPRDSRLDGPIVINEAGATTVVPPGWYMRVHASGPLILEREGAD
jgi:N-methylhydantoinase A